MKKLFIFLILLLSPLSSLLSPKSAIAASVKPFPPFSEEGNPDEDYLFDEIFPLFRYISPPKLEIFENLERSRNYTDLMVCPGVGSDRRDYYCDNQGDGCDGGEVDICHNDPDNKSFDHTTISNNGSCQLFKKRTEDPDEFIEGKCDYTQRPSISKKVKGTDFSSGDLNFPKIQSENLSYNNVGTGNAITWGSQFLNSEACEISFRQLIVVHRAKQTKSTFSKTGEWPLGWVDWGYKDSNMTKTLLEIDAALPDGISSQMNEILEGVDDFYLNAGKIEAVSDISGAKKQVCNIVAQAQTQTPRPTWLTDLNSAPMYSPSFRQGYTRPSICVWDICCPGARCKVEPSGVRRGLYYDTSISQTFGAALDDLLMSYSLEEGSRLFRQIVIANPLVRFATSASENAIPSVIRARLDAEISDRCRKYIPWGGWIGFGTHIDYLNPGDFLDEAKTCPDYRLAPELTKENAAAYPKSLLSVVMDFLWGQKEDEVDPVKKHFLTIPDLMGQSIQEIQQPVYDSRDTLAELAAMQEYNEGLSNTVEDDSEGLLGGKFSPVTAKRKIELYGCNDAMYSTYLTSIEAYAHGERNNCMDTQAVPAGVCDGQLFGKLLETGKYQQPSAKGQAYFDTYIKANLTPELMNTYAAAEKETGVPCEILAGIHFVEASNSPDGSLVSGRKIGTPEPDAGGKVFHSLLETAKYSGEHLKGKVGGDLKDVDTTITALSRYNGGGNSNCQLGYPYPIPYGGCPRAFEGEDDPYPTSFLDGKHDSMYLLYCADYTACAPQVFERPGSFTVALAVYNSLTKSGYKNSDLPTTPSAPKPSNAPSTTAGGTTPAFFPKSCGPESLSTALGCIPYTRDAFVSALLTFIVGIAGAIALVMMLIATVQIMTAAADAKKLQSGRDLFFSAVAGLLFLVFSVSILRLIAGDIIKLPGF